MRLRFPPLLAALLFAFVFSPFTYAAPEQKVQQPTSALRPPGA